MTWCGVVWRAGMPCHAVPCRAMPGHAVLLGVCDRARVRMHAECVVGVPGVRAGVISMHAVLCRAGRTCVRARSACVLCDACRAVPCVHVCRACVHARACACMRACLHACVCLSVHACVRAGFARGSGARTCRACVHSVVHACWTRVHACVRVGTWAGVPSVRAGCAYLATPCRATPHHASTTPRHAARRSAAHTHACMHACTPGMHAKYACSVRACKHARESMSYDG